MSYDNLWIERACTRVFTHAYACVNEQSPLQNLMMFCICEFYKWFMWDSSKEVENQLAYFFSYCVFFLLRTYLGVMAPFSYAHSLWVHFPVILSMWFSLSFSSRMIKDNHVSCLSINNNKKGRSIAYSLCLFKNIITRVPHLETSASISE